ncbi:orotate phosphoribosyltransferase-like protein [Methanobacterium alcaliphilum]|uniref:orotate phosphoribosyltransferase-like protein n=1 Tax=Methanobacterium alcaliphilum TaxID=392018 RepID=UPI00200A1E0A|nr:orotate phosphoribosyltransferase-like protein [Methanobacterium alcaliphilum]MCK9150938.1 orotate phosphoribosyltransferase-like protein [Methanobacterium alcaliphilum]
MNQELIKKANELRNRGFTTGEIADELNVSKDTARWLTLQSTGKKVEDKNQETPVDFAINWESLGGSSARMRYVSAAIADMALKHGTADVIVGIAVSGVPFATMMADVIDSETGIETALAVFHPKKHRKDEDAKGAISSNFASVEGKRVVIVDDVITSGRTIKEVIKVLKDQDAVPIAVTVLIDKKGISKVEDVPVESLIRVSRLG